MWIFLLHIEKKKTSCGDLMNGELSLKLSQWSIRWASIGIDLDLRIDSTRTSMIHDLTSESQNGKHLWIWSFYQWRQLLGIQWRKKKKTHTHTKNMEIINCHPSSKEINVSEFAGFFTLTSLDEDTTNHTWVAVVDCIRRRISKYAEIIFILVSATSRSWIKTMIPYRTSADGSEIPWDDPKTIVSSSNTRWLRTVLHWQNDLWYWSDRARARSVDIIDSVSKLQREKY